MKKILASVPWYGVGHIVACVVVGLIFNVLGPLLHDILRFVTGDVASISPRNDGTVMLVASALAITPVAMVLTFIPRILVGLFVVIREGDNPPPERPPYVLAHYSGTAGITLFRGAMHLARLALWEECYARWFFLGALGGISWLEGPVAFYVLFFIGNTVWATRHLLNVHPDGRFFLRSVPYFCDGVYLTVMFIWHGLPGAFVAHFMWNLLGDLPRMVSQARAGRALTIPLTG